LSSRVDAYDFMEYQPTVLRELAEQVVDRWDQRSVASKLVWAKVIDNQKNDTVGLRVVLEERVSGRRQ
jgi:hypothetical protein